MINKLEKILAYYHGILQIPHLLMNFVILALEIRSRDESGLGFVNESYINILLLSSIIDFFITSPLGLLFLFGFIKNKKWAPAVGLISVTAAFISSIVYVYAHNLYGMWSANVANILIVPLFSPSTLLFFVVLYKIFKGKEYFKR